MRGLRSATALIAVLIFVAILGFAYSKRMAWQQWFGLTSATTGGDTSHARPSPNPTLEQVKLSPQAQANLRLASKPLQLKNFWKTVQMPGQIVDRPGFSDRGVIAPITGVVTKVHQMPGDTVRPNDPLFTMRLLSEQMQMAQTELYKASQEIEITEETKKRLSKLGMEGAIPGARLIELDNQLRRLAVTEQAYRLELQTRGLTPEQIEKVGNGTFVTEMLVVAPQRRPDDKLPKNSTTEDSFPLYEMQELKVELGQQVQAGQTLCLLSHHESLYIEGRGFRREVPLLEKAIQKDWPVEIEFMEDKDSDWPSIGSEFTIRHISNTIDPASRTFAFYILLKNQSRTYEKNGITHLLWRFRPGQRVRIHIRSDEIENVFVVPADAVVREGPEAFVFRQNGDFFDRKAVHILYEDRQNAVIANDGNVPPGVFIAQNAATQLNRVLKTQRASGQTNMHVHADGTVHANH